MAPLGTVVDEVTLPAQPASSVVPESVGSHGHLSSVSDITSSVPSAIGELNLAETVAPLTGTVDSLASQTPIVNSVLPADVATTVTQPALGAIDAIAAPVLQVPQNVVSPLIETLDPVVRVTGPVLAVVDGTLDSLIPPLANTVEVVLRPGDEVAADSGIPPAKTSPDPAATPVTGSSPTVLTPGTDANAGTSSTQAPLQPPVDYVSSSLTDEGSAEVIIRPTSTALAPSPAAPSAAALSYKAYPAHQQGTAQLPYVGVPVDPHALGASPLPGGSSHNVQEEPHFAVVGTPLPGSISPLTSGSTSACAGSSSVSVGSSAEGAPASFSLNTLSGKFSQSACTIAGPQEPDFDPGSTPD